MKVAPALSYAAALRSIVTRLGAPAVRRIAGVAERTVQDWCDPDSPRSCPIHIAERLDRAWVEAGQPGRPLADLLRARLEAAAAPPPTITLTDHFPDLLTESAEANAALFVVLRAPATPNQRAIAAREIRQAIAAWEVTLPLLVEAPSLAMTRAPPG